MNSLSTFIYFKKHKRKTIALVALFTLAATGVMLFISLATETYIAPSFAVNAYLQEFSLVQSDGGIAALDPNLAKKIEASPDVARVIMQTNIRIKKPNTGGAYFPFRIFGLDSSDIDAVLDATGAAIKEGSLPTPSSNGVGAPVEVAENESMAPQPRTPSRSWSSRHVILEALCNE